MREEKIIRSKASQFVEQFGNKLTPAAKKEAIKRFTELIRESVSEILESQDTEEIETDEEEFSLEIHIYRF